MFVFQIEKTVLIEYLCSTALEFYHDSLPQCIIMPVVYSATKRRILNSTDKLVPLTCVELGLATRWSRFENLLAPWCNWQHA